MDELVEYQLQRAAVRGQKKLSRSILIVPIIDKIVLALDKVYASKYVSAKVDASGDEHFFCEEGDLFEIAGNLIDNAYKWCHNKVRISVNLDFETDKKYPGLVLIVEDDGPGIPQEKVRQVLRRGMRADEQVKGHGIGLAVVNELVQLYGGRLQSGESRYGGARWRVWLPSAV